MAVLITGVAGMIGSRFAGHLLNKGEQVIGIDNLSGGYADNIPGDVTFYNADCLDKLDYIFRKHSIDLVYHFAAYAAEGLSPFIRTFNYENNLVATANIVNCCINYKVKRLVFTSSMSVYGHGTGGAFHEDMPRSPIDPYGVAKSACEQDIEIAGRQHGLDYCIIRPHNVYGVNQNIWDKYRNVLGIWMYYKLQDKATTIFGSGEQRRAFSFIDDILEPLWRAGIKPEASHQIINLGGVKEYSINEASEVLIDIFGGGEKTYLEGRHEVHDAVPTYQKSVDILEFEHKTDLKEGLTKMWDWARKQPNRKQFRWSDYEIDKGIYSF